MDLKDKVVVVTGGANGIGKALCLRFAQEGARSVTVADVDVDGARAVADQIGGVAIKTDVSNEGDNIRLVNNTLERFGQIDLFCANAGITGEVGGTEVSNEAWQRIWEVNLMSHVYAARAVLPGMLERGEGYLLHTASAAGLLAQIGGAPYSVTKHAVVAFAEWLSITHGDAGLKVSCLCPQGVRTDMLLGPGGDRVSFLLEGAIEAEELAETVVSGLAAERFLILPHPEVEKYFQHKATDYDRWLAGMRKLDARVRGKKTEEAPK
jgi:NAD(P)-dependent dehydrogenase (short-subunit alcohol dehydrogenase family)